MLTLLLIALGVAAVVFTYLDIVATSSKFIYYALKERNRLFRDKYGYMNVKKAVIVYGAWLVGTTAGAICIHWTVGVAMYGVLALKGLWHWVDNRTVMKRRRELQTRKLCELREILNTPGANTNGFWLTIARPKPVAGTMRFILFSWIWVDLNDYLFEAGAIDELRRRIENLALQDPLTWFPVGSPIFEENKI